MTSRVDAGEHPILLYDGVCALCNRLVQFTLHAQRGRAADWMPWVLPSD